MMQSEGWVTAAIRMIARAPRRLGHYKSMGSVMPEPAKLVTFENTAMHGEPPQHRIHLSKLHWRKSNPRKNRVDAINKFDARRNA